MRLIRLCLGLAVLALGLAAGQAPRPAAAGLTPPVHLSAEQDHQRMMDLLHIISLRPGADPNHPQASNAVNYDESKANPYPNLPDPLLLNSGRVVTSAALWWDQRRPEIMEEFDREVYGRAPRNTPKVNWEVTGTSRETSGEAPVITKHVAGHVDNSSYPLITVNIDLTLTTPATARAPVPVIMEFGFDPALMRKFLERLAGSSLHRLLRVQAGSSRFLPKAGGTLSSFRPALSPMTGRALRQG